MCEISQKNWNLPPEFIVVGIVCCCIDILLLGGDNFEPVEPELLLLGLREVPIGLSSAKMMKSRSEQCLQHLFQRFLSNNYNIAFHLFHLPSCLCHVVPSNPTEFGATWNAFRRGPPLPFCCCPCCCCKFCCIPDGWPEGFGCCGSPCMPPFWMVLGGMFAALFGGVGTDSFEIVIFWWKEHKMVWFWGCFLV